jgi:hypothetical protein
MGGTVFLAWEAFISRSGEDRVERNQTSSRLAASVFVLYFVIALAGISLPRYSPFKETL